MNKESTADIVNSIAQSVAKNATVGIDLNDCEKCKEILVRMASEKDAESVFFISEQSFTGAEKWSLKLFSEDLKDPTKHYFLAFHKAQPQQIIGFIGYAHILDEAHIMDVAVLLKNRREGVGNALLQALIAHAKACGVGSVTLEVRVSNLAAKRLYVRHGFVSVGTRKNYYQSKEDAEIYWKEI